MTTFRSVALKLAPKITNLAKQNQDAIEQHVTRSTLSHFVFRKLWPTLLNEIPNTLEAVVRLLVVEFSNLTVSHFLSRLEEIESNPLQFSKESLTTLLSILEDMKVQFISDAGVGWRRLTLRLAWGPLLELAPKAVEVLMPHIISEVKSFGAEEWQELVRAHRKSL